MSNIKIFKLKKSCKNSMNSLFWIFILGARTFVPHPVSLTIDNVGGTATLLGLVAMAKDVEGLYAAVKALVCVVKSNRAAQQEMDRMKRYQVIFTQIDHDQVHNIYFFFTLVLNFL